MNVTLLSSEGECVTVSRAFYDRLAAYAAADRSLCSIIIEDKLIKQPFIIDTIENYL